VPGVVFLSGGVEDMTTQHPSLMEELPNWFNVIVTRPRSIFLSLSGDQTLLSVSFSLSLSLSDVADGRTSKTAAGAATVTTRGVAESKLGA
jgi:hypothetical protein